MPNPENLKGKGFDKNPGNINREGRPKKIYTILKEMGYSKSDVNTCFGEMIWYSHEQLTEVYGDSTKPIITQITAKALIESKSNGNISQIKEILEHVLGKPKQSVEVSKSDPVTGITIKRADG